MTFGTSDLLSILTFSARPDPRVGLNSTQVLIFQWRYPGLPGEGRSAADPSEV